MHQFWLVFVPLFVAVDAIGTMPMFLNLTEGLDRARVRKIIFQSTMTAMVVAVAFLAVGRSILGLLGITVADFMVAGGVLLFVISLNDMLTLEKKELSVDPESLGAVPLGVPLIVGPAVFTTSILLVSHYGFALTAIAMVLNILIAGIVLFFSFAINKFMGKSGAKTISKLAALILASIAVMIVRKGLIIFLTAAGSAPM